MKNTDFLDTFRSDLKKLLKANNLGQGAFVAHGVSQGSISNFLSGKRGLSLASFIALWPFVYGAPFPKKESQSAHD